MADSTNRVNRADKRRKHILAGNIVLMLVVAAVCLCGGAYMGIEKVLESPVFPQTTVIDGADISGMTYEEGSSAVLDIQQKKLDQIQILVMYNGNKVLFDAPSMGVEGNAKALLDEAYHVNKQEDKNLIGNYDATVEMRKGQEYTTDITIDEDVMEESIRDFMQKCDKMPIDAKAMFDKVTHEFTYTKSEPGTQGDQEKLKSTLIKQIDENSTDKVQVIGEVVQPSITTEILKENTVLIGDCQTKATNNENRNTNINLMCEAINGLVIEPGQTLSINDLVGERTAEKGYKEAPAIMDGKRLENDLGGGICQVSGTLYNAALKANMEIVERVRHSFPSAYLPIGLDATLNWSDKDLKLKNTSEYPIYIGATFDGKVASTKIYGQPLPEGMEIKIVPEMLKEIKSSNAEIITTDELPAGVRQTKISPRNGYDVDVYREYYQNGELVSQELVSQDRFPPIKAVVLVGTAGAQK